MKPWVKIVIPFLIALIVPFTVAFILLVNHEKEQAYEEIQRTHTTLGEATNQTDDDKKAWKSAIDSSALFATPVGLIGLGSYGCFLICKKLMGREKKD